MTETSPSSDERRSHPPMWLVEGLDVVEQRRPVFIAVTLGVIVLGGLLAWLAPGLVPPVPLVGAAVGLAALVLGLAVAVALDATDLRLRGPRHVGAAGGELVAVLPTVAEHAGASTLAAAVLEARDPAAPLLLGLAASGRDIGPTVAWTDALASALVAEGVSVLRIDLASGPTRTPGLLEVVRDGVKLASVVTFGPEPKLARLGAGEDLNAALAALTALPGRLPRDLDVLLVALPTAASRPVVTAVQSLDHVLIVAQRDRTSRVELIAGLDALEAAGTRAQVALLDDRTAGRLARRSPEVVADPATGPGGEPGVDPDGEVSGEPGVESRDETPAEPGSEASAEPYVAAPAEPGSGTPAGLSADPVADPADEPRDGSGDDESAATSDSGATPVESPDEVGPEPARIDTPPSVMVRPGSSASSPKAGEEAELGAEGEPSGSSRDEAADPRGSADEVDAPVEAVDEASAEPDTGPGPRTGGAFGVGGAALTAAGIAATFRNSDPGTPGVGTPAPVEEREGPDEVHGSRAGPSHDPGTAPPPRHATKPEPILGLDADDHEQPFDQDGEHRQPDDEWLSWDDTPREPGAGREPMEADHSEPRPVDLVHGAAEAAAIALVRFPVEPPLSSDEAAAAPEGALPVGRDAPVSMQVAPDLPPAPVDLDPTVADADGADPDRTDEMPAVGGQPEIGEADVAHEQMMQTTAQLSVLFDDLGIERDEGPLDTP